MSLNTGYKYQINKSHQVVCSVCAVLRTFPGTEWAQHDTYCHLTEVGQLTS